MLSNHDFDCPTTQISGLFVSIEKSPDNLGLAVQRILHLSNENTHCKIKEDTELEYLIIIKTYRGGEVRITL